MNIWETQYGLVTVLKVTDDKDPSELDCAGDQLMAEYAGLTD